MELKQSFIDFFKQKGHAHIASASVIPENDPTCLFTTAGMHPLVPYLLGEKHPQGRRLVNVQKCIRLTDIENVGNKTHHTFFEMLGNWSLGDYFKDESIRWSFELLTDVLGISVEKLGVSVFAGDNDAPKDEAAADIWRKLEIPEERIAFLPKEDNWWGPAGETGPCGPDTEIFYWSDKNVSPPKEFDPSDKRWVEIWNNVFMEYNKLADGKFAPLSQKNVDTGMGVERVTAVLQGFDDNYMTEIFQPIIRNIEKLSGKSYNCEEFKRPIRIIADHVRAVVAIAGDNTGIKPSNTDQGYILRRLIRRLTRFARTIGIDVKSDFEEGLVDIVVNQLGGYYPEFIQNRDVVVEVLKTEKDKFNRTLEKGLKEFDKIVNSIKAEGNNVIQDKVAFRLYDTFGFPLEIICDLAEEQGMCVDVPGFNECFKKHQEISRKGSEQKFKGGLADNSVKTSRLHTATHLLLAALKNVIDPSIYQMGSNITPERLRFDFPYPDKLTDEQIRKVEDWVNTAIQHDVPICFEEMNVEQAKAAGATGVFDERYGEKVKVYSMGDFSKEICGGPHASTTGELGMFKIVKEQSSSAGVRRIKAVIEDE